MPPLLAASDLMPLPESEGDGEAPAPAPAEAEDEADAPALGVAAVPAVADGVAPAATFRLPLARAGEPPGPPWAALADGVAARVPPDLPARAPPLAPFGSVTSCAI